MGGRCTKCKENYTRVVSIILGITYMKIRVEHAFLALLLYCGAMTLVGHIRTKEERL